jgi:hypothetical protein
MIKRIASVAFLSFLTIGAFAQGAFKFTSDDKHDFGIVEEGVQAEYEFQFDNSGDAPIVLTDVRASCGCTTPSWTKDPIPPGGKGSIKASYNSSGRIGVFNKSITITSNAAEPSKVVYIKGIVVKKEEPKAALSPKELKAAPKFSLDKNTHSFGKIERGQKVAQKFTVKNTGKSPLALSSFQSACSCISHNLASDTIAPGKSAVLELTYNPTFDGPNSDILTIFTNDPGNPRAAVTLSGEVVESLSTPTPLKEEKNTVPFGK